MSLPSFARLSLCPKTAKFDPPLNEHELEPLAGYTDFRGMKRTRPQPPSREEVPKYTLDIRTYITKWTRHSTEVALKLMTKETPPLNTNTIWHLIWIQRNDIEWDVKKFIEYLKMSAIEIVNRFSFVDVWVWLYYPNLKAEDLKRISELSPRVKIKSIDDGVAKNVFGEDTDLKNFVMSGSPTCIGARVDMLRYAILKYHPGVYSDMTDISFNEGQVQFIRGIIKTAKVAVVCKKDGSTMNTFYSQAPKVPFSYLDASFLVCFDEHFPQECILRAKQQCRKIFGTPGLRALNENSSGGRLFAHFGQTGAEWPWCEAVPTYITGPNTIFYAFFKLYFNGTAIEGSRIDTPDIMLPTGSDTFPDDVFIIDPLFYNHMNSRTWLTKDTKII